MARDIFWTGADDRGADAVGNLLPVAGYVCRDTHRPAPRRLLKIRGSGGLATPEQSE